MTLFDDADKQRIEAAIAALEQRTAAEVVVAVVPHSGRPWAMRALVAFGVGFAAALGWLELAPTHDPRWSLLLELVTAAAAFAALGWAPLEARLVVPAQAELDVAERAFALFTRRGLHRTRGGTGVLILLSELEHRAVILGDQPIHARLGEQGWERHVAHLVAAIKAGHAARGVVEVLAELGEVLAEIAPPEATNEDELPNRVLDER